MLELSLTDHRNLFNSMLWASGKQKWIRCGPTSRGLARYNCTYKKDAMNLSLRIAPLKINVIRINRTKGQIQRISSDGPWTFPKYFRVNEMSTWPEVYNGSVNGWSPPNHRDLGLLQHPSKTALFSPRTIWYYKRGDGLWFIDFLHLHLALGFWNLRKDQWPQGLGSRAIIPDHHFFLFNLWSVIKPGFSSITWEY